jgi:hypothetical protein
MKKSELRQLIKEEIFKTLNESKIIEVPLPREPNDISGLHLKLKGKKIKVYPAAFKIKTTGLGKFQWNGYTTPLTDSTKEKIRIAQNQGAGPRIITVTDIVLTKGPTIIIGYDENHEIWNVNLINKTIELA